MRKTIDQLSDYPTGPTSPDAAGGQYRLRVYEDDQAPVVLVTDASSQGPNMRWISGHGPQLAASVARAHLPGARELRLLSRFGLLQNGQAVYREHFRQAASPAIQPQASIMSQAEVEELIGQTLD